MKEYLITLFGNKDNRIILLTFKDGLLQKMELPTYENYTETDRLWLLNWLRSQVKESDLLANENDDSLNVKFRVQEVEQDLGFDNFWDTYGHKVGNKSKCKKIWRLMNAEEQKQVFVNIKKYKYWLTHNPRTDQIYPEGYLSQRRFENEYKI